MSKRVIRNLWTVVGFVWGFVGIMWLSAGHPLVTIICLAVGSVCEIVAIVVRDGTP